MGMIKALIILIAAAAANADPNRLKALLQGHRKADPDFQRHAALRVDPTWWLNGVAIAGGAESFFRVWLARRVQAAASGGRPRSSDRGRQLRRMCPFSVAFVFKNDGGDAFVLDFGGAPPSPRARIALLLPLFRRRWTGPR